jgi:hypothetical protein
MRYKKEWKMRKEMTVFFMIMAVICSFASAIVAHAFTAPKSACIQIAGTDGKKVSIKNPYKIALRVNEKNGRVQLKGHKFGEEDYEIWYFPSTSLYRKSYSVQIDLNGGGEKLRRKAEAHLLKMLGINKKQASKLRIWVGSQNYFDVQGVNYGLSFAGGEIFPSEDYKNK